MRSLVVSCSVVFVLSLAACVDTTPPAETGTGGSNGAGSGGSVMVAGSGGSEMVAGSGGGDGGGDSVMVAGSGGNTSIDAGAAIDGNSDSANGNPGDAPATTDTGAGDVDPPTHPLTVTATKTRHTHNFRAKDADPGVTFNDNTEIATVDPSSHTMVGKLILPFGGLGTNNGITGPVGDFLVRRGYHVLGVAAFQDYNVVIGDPAFYGDARRSVFEGKNYTHKNEFATINLTPSDGVAMRVQKALQYLQKQAPEEDWGYFLNADGTVRWSDVAFTGQSHGASNAPRFAKLVHAWRAVSFAGPRDNECNSVNTPSCEGVVTATWLTEPSATPIEGYYAVTGNQDPQYPQHLFAMYKANYVGQPVNVTTGAPYSNSHRIVADGGHAWFCDETTYKALCNYLFEVPPENANGP